jgi:membrane fusion protein (multidrug efflux system)
MLRSWTIHYPADWQRAVRGLSFQALAGVLAMLAGQPAASAQPTAPPPAVTVAAVVVKDVAPVYSFIGRVIAIQSVDVMPRVTAFIEDVPVQQGSDVKAGQVLFQLQKAQYEAALKQAQAQLASAQAALQLSQVAYERSAKLNTQGFEAQAKLDQALATRDQDQASVLTAQAKVVEAGLELSYCTIVSPIDGRIGAVTLTKGNLVTPSTPALATVSQLDPIRVVFSVSDRVMVSALRRTGATQNELAASLAVNLKLPDGSEYNHSGKIAFQGNHVDPKTGTVSVYADFPNPDRLLLPGAYENVELRRAQPQERPLVPAEALQTNKNGSFVLVVGQDDKVKEQPVTLGRQIAQAFIVEKGLTGGERVIIAGVQKVRPGETVNPEPAPNGSGPSGPSEQTGQGG